MERNVADRLLVTGCKLFEVAIVETEGCKWTETSHAAVKWQFRGEGGVVVMGGAVKLGEARKGVRTEKGRDERGVKVGFSIACYEPVV